MYNRSKLLIRKVITKYDVRQNREKAKCVVKTDTVYFPFTKIYLLKFIRNIIIVTMVGGSMNFILKMTEQAKGPDLDLL